MCPQTQYFDDPLFLKNLINKAVLDIEAPRISAAQIADQGFERRWVYKRIAGQ